MNTTARRGSSRLAGYSALIGSGGIAQSASIRCTWPLASASANSQSGIKPMPMPSITALRTPSGESTLKLPRTSTGACTNGQTLPVASNVY